MKTFFTFAILILCVIIIYKVMKAIEDIYNDNFNGPPAY